MQVTIAAFVVSLAALLLSGVAAVYARVTAKATERQADEARRQADTAQAELHLAYSPVLSVVLNREASQGSNWLYEIRNDGHKDLDSVVVQRPETSDRIRYPIARLGVTDYEDQVELGPMGLGEASGLVLCVGSTPTPPEFRVRISCRTGTESWVVSKLLEPGTRKHANP